MSRDCVVILVRRPRDGRDIDDMPARVFMRFTEPPSDEFLDSLAKQHPTQRVYCLSGASVWHSVRE